MVALPATRFKREFSLNLKEHLLTHARNGASQQVLDYYQRLVSSSSIKPDEYVLVAAIKACACKGKIILGRYIHVDIIDAGLESHVYIGSALVNMYVKCGSLDDGEKVFDGLTRYDVVCWNALLSGYAYHGHMEKMVQCFEKMNKSDQFQPNLATLNALIAGYSRDKLSHKALQVFKQMQQEGNWMPDGVTYASLLNACNWMEKAHDQGKRIHVFIIECGFESDAFIANSLVNLYVKCEDFKHAIHVSKRVEKMDCVTWNVLIGGYAMHGHIQEAIEVFNNMRKAGICPDLVTWNSLLTGCVQHGYGQQAFILFQQMQEHGSNSDKVTFVNALKICSLLSSLDQGKVIHACLLETEMCCNLFVCNALIDMYAKCGSLDDASRHFHALSKRDLVSWNTIIASYASYRQHMMVFECFRDMQIDGFQPDEITFLCVLSACTHMGFSEMGCMYFMSMRECLATSCKLEHYNCIVDLLGRKGCLKEAKSLLGMMPFEANIRAWTSLLCHCNTYGELKLGRHCFNQLLLIDNKYASSYELMSALYAQMGMWEDVIRVQELRRRVNAS